MQLFEEEARGCSGGFDAAAVEEGGLSRISSAGPEAKLGHEFVGRLGRGVKRASNSRGQMLVSELS
jgi:hypothetical protein